MSEITSTCKAPPLQLPPCAVRTAGSWALLGGRAPSQKHPLLGLAFPRGAPSSPPAGEVSGPVELLQGSPSHPAQVITAAGTGGQHPLQPH